MIKILKKIMQLRTTMSLVMILKTLLINKMKKNNRNNILKIFVKSKIKYLILKISAIQSSII